MCELLGGTPRPVPAYASSMSATSRPRTRPGGSRRCRTRTAFARSSSGSARECGHDQDEWPGRTEAIVPAVRRALGDDATLLVDANSCYTPAPGDRGRAPARAARRRPLRGAVPVLGAGVDGRGRRGARRRRHRRRAGLHARPVAADARAAGGRRRAAGRLLRRRVHARARGRPHGRGGGAPLHAALREPVADHPSSPCTCWGPSRTPARTWSSRSRARTTTRGRTASTTRRCAVVDGSVAIPDGAGLGRARSPGPGWRLPSIA